MRTINTMLCVAVTLLLGTTWASGETVSPYSVDFNTEIVTSYNTFRVASGWGHIAQANDYGEYPSYSWESTAGVDGTGCLKIPTQYSWFSGTTYDLLVTPPVTDTITIKAKKISYSGSIKFYKVTNVDGILTKGDEITVTTSLSRESFTTVTIGGLQGEMVGIWGDGVYIDDFTAKSAEIEKTNALTITGLKLESGTTPDCDAQNTFPVEYTVTLLNSGDFELTPSTTGYSLSLINADKEVTIYDMALTQNLAPGATMDVTLSTRVSYADYPDANVYSVKENVTSTTRKGFTITPQPYVALLSVRNTKGYEMTTNDGNSYAKNFGKFGMINADTPMKFIVKNEGPAPLTGTITVPAAFTVSKTTLNLEGNSNDTLTLTALATTPGIYADSMIIDAGEAGRFSTSISATVIDPNKYFEDFEGVASTTDFPAGWYNEDPSYWTTSKNSSSNNYASSNQLTMVKVITPRLRAIEGEKMTIDASRKSAASKLNVYYSTDRANWTLLLALTGSDFDETGGFSVPAFTTFTIDGIPAGEGYIAFESGYAYIDNIYGLELVDVTHDLMFQSRNIPESGEVNSEYTANATIYNIATNDEIADTYTATLYFNGEAVATSAPDTIHSASTADYTFAFTPHAVGTFPAFIKFEANDGYVLTTDTVQVTIDEESLTSQYTVGDITSYAYEMAPACPYYHNSIYEVLYTAEQLAAAGITNGAKITSLTYQGHNTSKDITATVNFYMLNCDDTAFGAADMTSNDEMTQVYSGDWTYLKQGSVAAPADMLVVEFNEPFVYTGGALRIKSTSVNNTSAYAQINFLYDGSITNQAYGSRSDNTTIDNFTSFSAVKFPVTTFGIAMTPDTLKGTICDSITGEPLAGVSIVLNAIDNEEQTEPAGNAPRRAAQVQYSGTSNADGEYAIPVLQSNKTYEATYSLEGYKTVTMQISDFGPDNDVVMAKNDDATGVTELQTSKRVDANVYTIDGRIVRRDATTLEGLAPGLYIHNGKKVVVR